jgi:hypothetical protein
MTVSPTLPATAFDGGRLLAAGPLLAVALAVKRTLDANAEAPLLVFDDATGRVIDLDLRGSDAEIATRLGQEPQYGPTTPPAEPNGRGRPKLGVVGREVTLLPRQWEWLAAQPGGASVTLRKLVEGARRSGESKNKMRQAQGAAYAFMTTMAGNLPGYEEATRALFANDRAKFEVQIADWPADIRAYALRLAGGPADTTTD